MTKNGQGASTIQKALDALLLFKQKPKWTFGELQAELGYNKSTLSRILAVLVSNHFLSKIKPSRYELGLNLFLLGRSVEPEQRLRRAALPEMEALSRKVGLTVHLGILEAAQVVIIAKAEPQTRMQMISRVGAVVPAHCTGQGKTLLAHSSPELVQNIIDTHGLTRFTPNTICTANHLRQELDRIRERGYAVDHSEHERHLICAGIPIQNREAGILAALSITGTVVDFPDEQSLEPVLVQLKETRAKIMAAMGHPEPGGAQAAES